MMIGFLQAEDGIRGSPESGGLGDVYKSRVLGGLVASGTPTAGAIWAGIGGALAIALTTGVVAISLAASGDELIPAAQPVFFAPIPGPVSYTHLTLPTKSVV